jgi:hypothetical protein
MERKRKVEVFTAGCSLCDEVVALVKRLACPSCEVSVVDLRERGAADRAGRLGVRTAPAVAVDGKLAGCCTSSGPTEEGLRAAGVGRR